MSSRQERARLAKMAQEGLILNEQATDAAVRELFLLYDEAASQIEGNVTALVGRFAQQNDLSMETARQLLDGKEHSRWRQSLEAYIGQLPKSASGSALELELNTLAMKSRLSREEQLLSEVYRHMADMAGQAGDGLRETLSGIYRTNYYRGLYNMQQSMGLYFNVAKINEKRLLQILRFPWADEKTFSERIWGKADDIAASLRRELTLGYTKGSSVQEMARNIRGAFDVSRYEAERLVRTECKFFANQGELEGYKQNGIEEYRYIGGSEGSDRCECARVAAASPYKVAEAQAGENYPPLHPNCLCMTVAHFGRSMFDRRPDVVPLAENEKFLAWVQRQQSNP